MTTMVIYSILNTRNQKRYIGRTIKNPPEKRWSRHKTELKANKHVNLHLQRAWLKDGPEAFFFEVLEICQSLEHSYEREKHWIKHYQSTDPKNGYNIHEGGETGVPSLDGRRRISERHKGRTLSAEHRAKISAANKGRTISEEARRKTGETLRKRYAEGSLVATTPSPKIGPLHPMWGKTHTNEVRKRLSRSSGRSYDERMGPEKAAEVVAKKRETNKGEGNPFYKPFDIEYAKDQIDRGVLASDIADELGVSPPTLSKRFRETYGLTIDAYKRTRLGYGHIDMELVRSRLEQGDLLRDIALDVGVTYKTLSVRFKTTYGLYPKQYMASWRRRK